MVLKVTRRYWKSRKGYVVVAKLGRKRLFVRKWSKINNVAHYLSIAKTTIEGNAPGPVEITRIVSEDVRFEHSVLLEATNYKNNSQSVASLRLVNGDPSELSRTEIINKVLGMLGDKDRRIWRDFVEKNWKHLVTTENNGFTTNEKGAYISIDYAGGYEHENRSAR